MSERPHVLPEGLWVDPATASLLVDALRVAFREVERRDGLGPNPRLVELARAAEEVSRRWAAERQRNIGAPLAGAERRMPSVSLSTADAAARLGIGERAMRGLAQRGTVPAIRAGRRLRFALADVEDAAAERRARHASRT